MYIGPDWKVKMEIRVKHLVQSPLGISIVLAGLTAMTVAVGAQNADEAVLQADRQFVQSVAKADTVAVGKLLDDKFTWTGAAGKTWTRAQVLQSLPSPVAGYDAEPKERTYGDVGTVQASRGKVYVLRLWVKRPGGWRAIAYHEVQQLPAPPGPAGPGVSDCENPCKTVPYKSKNQAEKDLFTSWQQLETAVTAHDSAAWSAHAAEEFLQVVSNNDHPLDKAGRMAVLDQQKKSGVASAPPPLVSAELFDFGDTIVMKALHQPYRGKPIRVTRVWITRDGKWVMAISYQTTIRDAPAKGD